MDQLKGVTGTFPYEIVGSGNIPPEASELHQQAREAGGRGNYDQALELLGKAHQLAPEWPYPVYDTAFTYLLMKDSAKALDHYRKTVELSPRGFFTAITALDSLEKEADGKLPEGTYFAYLSLEWIEDPTRKEEAVRSLVEHVPQFAPAWKELAMICEDDNRKLQAIEDGLNADPDAETLGILLINKALTLSNQGKKQQAIQILGNLALDPRSTFANEQMAKSTLGFVAQ